MARATRSYSYFSDYYYKYCCTSYYYHVHAYNYDTVVVYFEVVLNYY